ILGALVPRRQPLRRQFDPMPDSGQDLSNAVADRYRVEREIGRGGMAAVFLARDLRHDRDVAIKVLHPELAAALGGDRFLAEIKTTARLQHPHILPLLDSGEANGVLYYVMPFVAGESPSRAPQSRASSADRRRSPRCCTRCSRATRRSPAAPCSRSSQRS